MDMIAYTDDRNVSCSMRMHAVYRSQKWKRFQRRRILN